VLCAIAFSGEASARFDSQFIVQNVPTSMTAGQSYPVSVTFRNTGDTTWTNATGPGTLNAYSLGTQNPQDNVNWGLTGFPNRVPVPGSVVPGATTTFTFDVVAPATPGAYDFQWKMVDDYVAWFGNVTPDIKITVSPPVSSALFLPNAQFVAQSVPQSMTAGQTYAVSITLKNNGNTTWTNTTGPGTPNAYSLGSQNPQDNVNWGITGFPNRVPVPGSVAPGNTVTFMFDVVAPATPGRYDFQWQMVDDDVAWFGDATPDVKVTVSLPTFYPNAQFVAQSVPASMTAGQSYPVSITLKNNGNTTWTNTTGPGTPNAYSLGTKNPQDNVTWGLTGFPNRVPVAGLIAPGATTTFVFDVVAPAMPGTHDFQWQMVDDYVTWFGDDTPDAQVLVGAPVKFIPGQISFVAAPLTFAQPIIGDVNGDGWLEPFGTINDGGGVLTVLDTSDLGLQDLFSDARPNDFRIADLDGDGCADIVAQGYSAFSAATNVDSRALLYFGDGAGHFTQDVAFGNLNLNGRGEGLVVADFNNDGATDLYLPYYTFGTSTPCIPADECPNAPQSYLLLNDGTGHFTEGDAPGTVDFSAVPGGQPEGAQAVDVNDDGLIDLYVAGHLFLNIGVGINGRVAFADCNCGVPKSPFGLLVDEGAKFLDWDNDGKLDLLLQNPNSGPQLYRNVGTRSKPRFELLGVRVDGLGPQFAEKISTPSGSSYAALRYCASYGLNVYDLDNDGLEDVIVAGSVAPQSPGCDYPNVVFRNTGTGFESIGGGDISGWQAGGVFAFGDIDRDGKIDLMYVGPYPYYFTNATSSPSAASFTVDVRGANGEQNQHGRVIRVLLPKPGCALADVPGCTLTRAVDGGSGYHSQNQYPVLVGTPYAGKHDIEVLFPNPAGSATTVSVKASASPGQYVQIFAPSMGFPSGRVSTYDRPPTGTTCKR
jgi:hypothetical protein